MPAHTIEIPWGGQTLPVVLPEGWELMGTLEPSPRAAVADAAAEAERAVICFADTSTMCAEPSARTCVSRSGPPLTRCSPAR